MKRFRQIFDFVHTTSHRLEVAEEFDFPEVFSTFVSRMFKPLLLDSSINSSPSSSSLKFGFATDSFTTKSNELISLTIVSELSTN